MGQFIRKVHDLAEIVTAIRSQGKKVVYTAGIFDVFHIGQIRALHDAKSRGHYLIVGVHDDDFARERLDGDRPFVSRRDRVELLEHIDWIDYVTPAESSELESILEVLDADILVTGVDTSLTINVDKKAITKNGGRVVSVASRRGASVAQLLKRYRSGASADDAQEKPTVKKSAAKKKSTKASATKSTKASKKKKSKAKSAAPKKKAATAKKTAAAKKKTTKKKTRASKKKPELVSAR